MVFPWYGKMRSEASRVWPDQQRRILLATSTWTQIGGVSYIVHLYYTTYVLFFDAKIPRKRIYIIYRIQIFMKYHDQNNFHKEHMFRYISLLNERWVYHRTKMNYHLSSVVFLSHLYSQSV